MISDEAIEAAAKAMAWAHCPAFRTADECWQDVSDAAREDWKLDARAGLKAAAPHMLNPEPGSAMRQAMDLAWDQAYKQGVEDERTSAAVGTDYGPNRTNPYRGQA